MLYKSIHKGNLGNKSKLLFILILFFSGISILLSQNKRKEDIVYLKNGKIIKGDIIKYEFGTVSIKIADSTNMTYKTIILQQNEISDIKKKTTDSQVAKSDSIQTFIENGSVTGTINKREASGTSVKTSDNLKDLMMDYRIQPKIVNRLVEQPKEILAPVTIDKPANTGFESGGSSDTFDPFSIPRPRRQPKIWNRNIRGYRGFVDYGYIFGIGDDKNDRLEFATSHGYHFNPIFYIGIGAAYHLTMSKKDSSLPVFFNTRVNFLDEYTTPFWDVRSGYSFKDGKGFYFNTTLGISFTKKGKSALNVGLSYSLQNAKYERPDKKNSSILIKENINYHGLGIRVSFEY